MPTSQINAVYGMVDRMASDEKSLVESLADYAYPKHIDVQVVSGVCMVLLGVLLSFIAVLH